MSAHADLLIWAVRRVPHGCVVKELVGVEDSWELNEGVPRAEGFSADAAFRMDPDRPHDTVLTDNLKNIDKVIVASGELRRFLESRAIPKVEYLPLRILDHRDRPVAREFCIVHPIDPVECLDLEASGAEWSELDPTAVDTVERIVFDPDRLDPSRPLFRARHFGDLAFVRRELAESIDREGFTGIRWIELDAYPEV